MANIDKYLNDIETAVYGEEVRSAIHDSIQAMNEEIEVWTGLQDGSVTTRKIANGAVTKAKLGTDVNTILDNMKTGFDGVEYGTPGEAVRGSDGKISETFAKITGNEPIYFTNPSDRKFINTNGNTTDYSVSESPSSNYKYAVVLCSAGDIITIQNAQGGTLGRLWAFVDSSNNIISKADIDVSVSNIQITAPTGTTTLVLNIIGDGVAFRGVSNNYRISEIQRSVDSVVSRNLVGNDTDFYPVSFKNGDIITVSTADGSAFSSNTTIEFYADKTSSRLSYYNLQSYTKRTITINETTATANYIKITKQQSVNVMCNFGDYAMSYVPYFYPIQEQIADVDSSIIIANSNVIVQSSAFVPFRANQGDTVIVQTVDGSSFANGNSGQISFYDKNKKRLGYYGIEAYRNDNRVISDFPFGSVHYVALNFTQNIRVVDTSINSNNPNSSFYTGVIKDNAFYDRKNIKKSASKCFIFFSDIHGAETNGNRIFDYAKAVSADAIINGGDIEPSVYSDDIDWYFALENSSSIDVLNCVGNHDIWESIDPIVEASQKDVYDKFIAPVAAKVSNIVQPSAASENGLCYYYKDYGDIRLIILSAMVTDDLGDMQWDTDQKEWFESTLTDAKTNNKKVLCVNHAPYKKGNAVFDPESNLNSWYNYNLPGSDTIQLSEQAVSAVANFMADGGVFICWLTGHVHADYVMTHKDYPDQFMINIATAKFDAHFDGYVAESGKTYMNNYDCFDYIGIDLTNSIIKVLRVGYNQDSSMKIRNRFAYNYSTHKIISKS